MIRPARAADVSAVEAIVGRAFSHYVTRIGVRPAPMDEDYAELAARGDVYVEGEPLSGVLILGGEDEHLFVEVIAVDPGRQRRGLGAGMMRFAEREAERRGAGEVRLFTHELMTENRAFYAALGYEEYAHRVEGPFSRVYLRKRVAPGERRASN